MGLIASVYRNTDITADCTNGGWSSRFTKVCIVNAEGPFEPTEDCPGVIVRKHRTMKSLNVVSVADDEANKWTMAGGNFLHTSDSRLGELVRDLLGADYQYSFGAISIHDRFEG
jgi:hypothetical protein